MNILAVCNHVGGLNAIKPIIKEIDFEHSVTIFTNNSNKGKFNDLSIPIFYIDYKITIYQAIEFLKQKNIQFLISSTSEPEDKVVGRLESIFVFSAKKIGIKSISVLDCWQKYKERFSLNNKNSLEAIPDKIYALDKKCKDDLITNGFAEENIIVSGNPA